MELKQLSNDQLLTSLDKQFALERNTSHHILLHLKEICLRRLYAERGYPNLFSMLVQHFHQSESAANQRLKALELMLDVPIVEERLIFGDLSLSTVAMAQRQIKREEKLTGLKVSKEKKAEIVESITNKTMAQAEGELFKLLPETASNPQSYERRISEDATRLNLTVPDDVLEMMVRLKEIWAHVDPSMDHVEVMRRAFKITLQKVDPSQKGKPDPTKKTKADSIKEAKVDAAKNDELQRMTTRSLTESVKHRDTKRLTYYGKEFDRVLWERAQSRCEFVDEVTGKRCDCRFGLQREHVIPLALGGTNELSNMQILCATHNQLRARKVFGDKKIDSYQISCRRDFRQ